LWCPAYHRSVDKASAYPCIPASGRERRYGILFSVSAREVWNRRCLLGLNWARVSDLQPCSATRSVAGEIRRYLPGIPGPPPTSGDPRILQICAECQRVTRPADPYVFRSLGGVPGTPTPESHGSCGGRSAVKAPVTGVRIRELILHFRQMNSVLITFSGLDHDRAPVLFWD